MSAATATFTPVAFSNSNYNNPIWRKKPNSLPNPICKLSNYSFVTKATSSSSNPESDNGKKTKKKKKKLVIENKEKKVQEQEPVAQEQEQQLQSSSVSVIKRLDDVNPVGLGRRSRQVFDEVWRKFSGLGQISRTIRSDDESSLLIREGGPMCEFAIPGAQNTTVLVVGATSRVGRIVVRKLMLRGYTVKALVRKAEPEVVDMLPRSVELVTGDVGDPSSLKNAVQGCNKIIYCATARSSITGDLIRVDHQGVYNLTKALQEWRGLKNQKAQGLGLMYDSSLDTKSSSQNAA